MTLDASTAVAIVVPIVTFAVSLAGAGFKIRSESMSFHRDYLEQAKSAYARVQSEFVQKSLDTISKMVKKNTSTTGFNEEGLQKDISSAEFENSVKDLSKITLDAKSIMDTFDMIWQGRMKLGNSLFIFAFVVGANVLIAALPDSYQDLVTAVYFADAIAAIYGGFQYQLFRSVSNAEERFLKMIQGQTF